MGENKNAVCRTMPFYECREGIIAIDEFDCTEIYVVVGEKRALVIDTGTGIGDLKGLIETRITDKPYDVVATHNHVDHLGGAGWFSQIYIHPDDMHLTNRHFPPTYEFRKKYVETVHQKEKKYYEYDAKRDIRQWEREPEFLPLEDGQVFDLGGRTVTAFCCPGHTDGEMVFLDDKTRTLLCGDAFNCNWLMSDLKNCNGRESAEIALKAMKRIYGMREKYDAVYNFHHDYRGFGSPLAPDVVPSLICCLEQVLDGTAEYKEIPDALNPPETKTVAVYKNVFITYMDGDIRTI